MTEILKGKVKTLYSTDDPQEVLVQYEDCVTAGNGQMIEYPKGKGTICCLMSLLWLVVGYSLAFGDGGSLNQFVGGLGNFLMAGIQEETLSGSIPESNFALFQMTFAVLTPAIISGAA